MCFLFLVDKGGGRDIIPQHKIWRQNRVYAAEVQVREYLFVGWSGLEIPGKQLYNNVSFINIRLPRYLAIRHT